MGRSRLFSRLGVLSAVTAMLWSLSLGGQASADDAVATANPAPTEAAVASPMPDTPLPTEAAPVATEPSSLPPTVTRERVKAETTVIEAPTVLEGPAPTAPPSHADRPFPTATFVAAPSAPTPSAIAPVDTSPLPEAPLPSPEQLRENARLRWGKGIPADVRRWAFLIVPAARKYHVSAGLVAAVMTMESGGDPLAYSPSDARGLMQVLHGPWDPRKNVYTGVRMLAEYHDLFPDWTLALAAYNAGPNAVSQYGGIPPFRETRDYVIVVSYLWDLYSHRHLTKQRRVLYHATLRDLEQFGRERRKVARLARLAHIHDVRLLCSSCGSTHRAKLFSNLDPFWPIPSSPDPLQHVDPYVSGP